MVDLVCCPVVVVVVAGLAYFVVAVVDSALDWVSVVVADLVFVGDFAADFVVAVDLVFVVDCLILEIN